MMGPHCNVVRLLGSAESGTSGTAIVLEQVGPDPGTCCGRDDIM